MVVSNQTIPAEKQYLSDLRKEAAAFDQSRKNFEPFDFEFQDEAWGEEHGHQQIYLPKKGFSWTNPEDPRFYGKCWKFAYWDGQPLCVIGPDCKQNF